MELDIPQELASRFVTCDMEAKLYFDKYQSQIKAELRFQYGDNEFNSFENPSSGEYIIVRQREKEDEIITQLLQLGFYPYKNFYLLRDEEKIYEFLSGRVMELEDFASLYYSEDFRKLGIRSPGGFKAGVRMNSEIDMLELDFSFGDVAKDELRALFYSFQVKKKYYRLKNGSFINLDDDAIGEIAQILDSLNINDKSMKEDAVLLEKHHAVYLDKVFSDKDFEFTRDYDFTNLIDRILNPTIADYKIPDGIRATLRSYQMTGFKWLKTLADNELGEF